MLIWMHLSKINQLNPKNFVEKDVDPIINDESERKNLKKNKI